MDVHINSFHPFCGCSLLIQPRAQPGFCLSSSSMSLLPCDPAGGNPSQRFSMGHQVEITPFISNNITSVVSLQPSGVAAAGTDDLLSWISDSFDRQCSPIDCQTEPVVIQGQCPGATSTAGASKCDISVAFTLTSSFSKDDDGVHGADMAVLRTVMMASVRTQANFTTVTPQEDCTKECEEYDSTGGCELWGKHCTTAPPYSVNKLPTQLKITSSEWGGTALRSLTLRLTTQQLPEKPPGGGGCPHWLTTADTVMGIVGSLPITEFTPVGELAGVLDGICALI